MIYQVDRIMLGNSLQLVVKNVGKQFSRQQYGAKARVGYSVIAINASDLVVEKAHIKS